MIGKTLSHYEVLEKIGEGGMGVVYKAHDTRLNRQVALKALPAGKATDPERRARFLQEAQAASALNHPNIITIYDIGEAEGTHFIAYEFIDGKTLREFATASPPSIAAVLDIGLQIATALVEAHRAGIVHRDLKLDNVMVRPTGLVKLLDFGIARLSAPADAASATVTALHSRTHSGMLIGTPEFMSPEQARGMEINHQTDLFSFGVLLYQLLTGRSPFAADTVSDVIVAVLTQSLHR